VLFLTRTRILKVYSRNVLEFLCVLAASVSLLCASEDAGSSPIGNDVFVQQERQTKRIANLETLRDKQWNGQINQIAERIEKTTIPDGISSMCVTTSIGNGQYFRNVALMFGGKVTGETHKKMRERIDEFVTGLSGKFQILPDDEPLSGPEEEGIAGAHVPVKYDAVLKARFHPPRIMNIDGVSADVFPLAKYDSGNEVGFSVWFSFNLFDERDLESNNIDLPTPTVSSARLFPLWDGKESIASYAARVNLSPTRTLEIGSGEKIEMVLVPAGEFTMGTPAPIPIDKARCQRQVLAGWVLMLISAGLLIFLLGSVIVQAVLKRQRPRYSLSRWLVMTVLAGMGVIGTMHWQYSSRVLEREVAEYPGSVQRFEDSEDAEKPAHTVTITAPYYMSKFAITQEQYTQVMDTTASGFSGKELPVRSVSWNAARKFCYELKSYGPVRLPTEAEWEFACRAGTTTAYHNGDSALNIVGWHADNSARCVHPVGQKSPNAFGLYDMHGNVWQWCEDVVAKYPDYAIADPRHRGEGEHILRGGSYLASAKHCRAACRSWCNPIGRYDVVGFRIVMNVETK
jgi:formylglycine-generating enzyme required for sulfatase activity